MDVSKKDYTICLFDGSVSIALPFQGVERSSSSAGGISCAPDGLRWFASLMFVIDLDGAVSFDVISDLGLSDDDHMGYSLVKYHPLSIEGPEFNR